MATGQMSYRYLGKCGLKVSVICLGTMTFGQTEVSCSAVRTRVRAAPPSFLHAHAICMGRRGWAASQVVVCGHTQGCRPGQCDEATAHSLLDAFVQAGGNFIDTADVYQLGLSEAIIGNWLVKHPELRSRLVLATKVKWSVSENGWLYASLCVHCRFGVPWSRMIPMGTACLGTTYSMLWSRASRGCRLTTLTSTRYASLLGWEGWACL